MRPAGGRGRLIFALDATASREPSWDRACRIQGEMFEATAGLGGLDVELVFYRGFNECKASRWMASAADLHRAMRAVSCLGGETQIERVLDHAIAETKKRKVDALVFVGDAMEEDVDRLCRLAGELGLLGVPAFVFHEGDDPVAARAFKQIAKLSRGAYLQLRFRERGAAQGTARRGRGLCRRRLPGADRLQGDEGRRDPAADRAAARLARTGWPSSAGWRSSAASCC